jgi:hypothetical protein
MLKYRVQGAGCRVQDVGCREWRRRVRLRVIGPCRGLGLGFCRERGLSNVQFVLKSRYELHLRFESVNFIVGLPHFTMIGCEGVRCRVGVKVKVEYAYIKWVDKDRRKRERERERHTLTLQPVTLSLKP